MFSGDRIGWNYNQLIQAKAEAETEFGNTSLQASTDAKLLNEQKRINEHKRYIMDKILSAIQQITNSEWVTGFKVYGV